MENKNDKTISEIDELKLIYYEIINGVSFTEEKSLFIKHFSEKESYLSQRKRNELLNFYSKNGFSSEKELLQKTIKNEEWSEEKETKILELISA